MACRNVCEQDQNARRSRDQDKIQAIKINGSTILLRIYDGGATERPKIRSNDQVNFRRSKVLILFVNVFAGGMK